MTLEEAIAYFKPFYHLGSMNFPEIYSILYAQGWSVRLVKNVGPVWEFSKIS